MDALTLEITGLAHDGRGIARLPGDDGTGERGMVAFVSHALPGQVVRAELTRRRGRFWEASAKTLLRPAPDAVPPLCPHHDQCGGCPLQTMPYAAQLGWKRTLALDSLERIGGFGRPLLEDMLPAVLPSPALAASRNKMEFAFGQADEDSGSLLLGLRRRNGRGVVPVPGCVLLPPDALHMVDAACARARACGFAAHRPRARREGGANRAGGGFWRFLVLRRGLAGNMRSPRWWATCITSPGSAEQRAAVRALGHDLLAKFPRLAAFIHEERARDDALAQGQKRVLTLNAHGYEDPQAALLHLPLGGRLFGLDAASFFQINTAAAQILARLCGELLPPPSGNGMPGGGAHGLLDVYCGAGAPGLLVAGDYARLLGLEADRSAVLLARDNARLQGHGHCRYQAGDAARLLHAQGMRPGQWHSVLLDPPRAGLDPRVFDALQKLAPRRILYISCNPATLARDAALLRRDFCLRALAAVDLFPHTPHVECLSLWQAKNRTDFSRKSG